MLMRKSNELVNQKEDEKMKDICYKCGKSQEYGTMKDINEIDFDIFCDECYDKLPKKIKKLDK